MSFITRSIFTGAGSGILCMATGKFSTLTLATSILFKILTGVLIIPEAVIKVTFG